MIKWCFFFLFFNSILLAQENQVEKWMADNQMDSIYTSLTNKKKSDTLSNKEFSFLIYSALATLKYRNGLAFSQEWEKNSLRNKDSLSVIKARNYRTQLYYALGEYDKSIATALSQIAYYEGKNNLIKIIQNKLNLGLSYTQLEDFKKAKQVYQGIPQDSIKDSNTLNTFYINYSNILAGLGDYKEALDYMLLNLKLIKAEYPENLPLIYSNISSIYYDMDTYQEALLYLDSASSSLTNHQENYYKQLIYQNKYSVWTVLKNSDSAFYYLEKLREVDKIVAKKDLDEELINLKNALKKEEVLNEEIRIAQKEIARKDKLKFWIIGFFAFLLISGLSLFYFLRLKTIQVKNKNIELEINLLRNQINPHFIFNTLASIQSLIRQGKNEDAILYLNIFSKLTRQILEDSRKNSVRLSAEVDFIKKYVEIQQLRKNNFDFEVHVSDEVRDILDEITLPSLTLQPFIENAIQHGFKNIDYRGHINLKIEIKNEYLYIEIEDNGTGLKTLATNQKHTSHATDITRERLRTMDRKKKTKSELSVKNKISENGVVVIIQLPVMEGEI